MNISDIEIVGEHDYLPATAISKALNGQKYISFYTGENLPKLYKNFNTFEEMKSFECPANYILQRNMFFIDDKLLTNVFGVATTFRSQKRLFVLNPHFELTSSNIKNSNAFVKFVDFYKSVAKELLPRAVNGSNCVINTDDYQTLLYFINVINLSGEYAELINTLRYRAPKIRLMMDRRKVYSFLMDKYNINIFEDNINEK